MRTVVPGVTPRSHAHPKEDLVTAPNKESSPKPMSDLVFDVTVEIPKGNKNKY